MQLRQKTPEEISAEIEANAGHNRQLLMFNVDHHVRKQKICPHVPIDMLGLFARTCQSAEADTAHFRIMTAAVYAEPVSYQQKDETTLAALVILRRHPGLLFTVGMITDHFGRRISASPYQLFHGADDVWALNQIHKEIIPKIDGGEAKAQAQYQEQFPNCKLSFDSSVDDEALYDDRNIAQIAQVAKNLENIVAAITVDPCTYGLATLPETSAEIENLWQLFAPRQGEVIRTGLHFPIAIMQEIFKVYDVQYDAWDEGQLSLFSREVIGAALAASTAVDGQCFKYGLRDLDTGIGPDRRDGLICLHPKGIPQELAPLRGKLGRTMFVDPYEGGYYFQSSEPGCFDLCYKERGDSMSDAEQVGLVRAYCVGVGELSDSNLRLANLMRERRKAKTSRFVIGK